MQPCQSFAYINLGNALADHQCCPASFGSPALVFPGFQKVCWHPCPTCLQSWLISARPSGPTKHHNSPKQSITIHGLLCYSRVFKAVVNKAQIGQVMKTFASYSAYGPFLLQANKATQLNLSSCKKIFLLNAKASGTWDKWLHAEKLFAVLEYRNPLFCTWYNLP